MIAIVDYGMGNLRSVQKGLEKVGCSAFITSQPEQVVAARGVILPGVGAFGDAMHNLRRTGLDVALKEAAAQRKPLLGICLGLQLLFEGSEENGWHEGLGLMPGRVVRLPEGEGRKIPHMGWNQLNRCREEPVLKDIPEGSYYYFVHSYYARTEDSSLVAATADYGMPVPAVVSRDNLIGIQFHPEKSSALGLKILRNYGELVDNADNPGD